MLLQVNQRDLAAMITRIADVLSTEKEGSLFELTNACSCHIDKTQVWRAVITS